MSSVELSRIVQVRTGGSPPVFSTRSLELEALAEQASPLLVFDDFRVSAPIFPPHPHAGFSAVTYVFPDSRGALRSRDSLGNDAVVGPGSVVWTTAGSGVIHEETPAEAGRELHGLQLFVNLSARNKLMPPRSDRLGGNEVPEWRGTGGDRVRVVVGSFKNVSSPLIPPEPFVLLDVDLRQEISFELPAGHNGLVYVARGTVEVDSGRREQRLEASQGIGLRGSGRTSFRATNPAHLVLLAGMELREPVVAEGPFIMNDRAQVQAAVVRYQSGAMGRLSPASRNEP